MRSHAFEESGHGIEKAQAGRVVVAGSVHWRRLGRLVSGRTEFWEQAGQFSSVDSGEGFELSREEMVEQIAEGSSPRAESWCALRVQTRSPADQQTAAHPCFGDQRRLADPSFAPDKYQARTALRCLLDGGEQAGQHPGPTHEGHGRIVPH